MPYNMMGFIDDNLHLDLHPKTYRDLCSSKNQGVTWAQHGLPMQLRSGAVAAFEFPKVVHDMRIALVYSQGDQGINACLKDSSHPPF